LEEVEAMNMDLGAAINFFLWQQDLMKKQWKPFCEKKLILELLTGQF